MQFFSASKKPTHKDEPLELPAGVRVRVIPGEFYGGKRSVAPATSLSAPPPLPPVAIPPRVPQASTPSRAPAISTRKPFLSKWIFIGGGALIVLAAGGAAFVLLGQKKPSPPPTPPTPVGAPEVVVATPPPVVEPAPEIAVTSTPQAPTVPDGERSFVFSSDLDIDGLTDVEEALYGSGIQQPDSDNDNFIDGNEVFHLYDPSKPEPATLFTSGLVKAHTNRGYAFTILYPSPWVAQSTTPDERETLFTAESGEFVGVLVEQNPDGLSFEEWYRGVNPLVDPATLARSRTKSGLGVWKSPDKLIAYVPHGFWVYIIQYNIGVRVDANFFRTYEMMVNSFKSEGTPTAAATPPTSESTTTTDEVTP